MLLLIGSALLLVGFAGAVVFIGLYSYRAKWWRSEVGWFLVTFPGALGLLELNGLIFRAFGDYPGRQIVSVVLFAVVVAATWWCVALLLRAHHKRPREGKR